MLRLYGGQKAWVNLARTLFLLTQNTEDKNWVLNAKLHCMSELLAMLFKNIL